MTRLKTSKLLQCHQEATEDPHDDWWWMSLTCKCWKLMLRPMNFEMKVYKMRKSFGEGSQHSRPLCHIELKPTMVHGSPKEKANSRLKNLSEALRGIIYFSGRLVIRIFRLKQVLGQIRWRIVKLSRGPVFQKHNFWSQVRPYGQFWYVLNASSVSQLSSIGNWVSIWM